MDTSAYLYHCCLRRIAKYAPRLDLYFGVQPANVPIQRPNKLHGKKHRRIQVLLQSDTLYTIARNFFYVWLYHKHNVDKTQKAIKTLTTHFKAQPTAVVLFQTELIEALSVANKFYDNKKNTHTTILLTSAHKIKCAVCTQTIDGNKTILRRCKCRDRFTHQLCKLQMCPVCFTTPFVV